jgi:sporulation protein YlmC with PRC-barrel domain
VSERELRIERLVGRRVWDGQGRSLGRIEDLICEIELGEGRSDYMVRSFCVGSFGALDALTGSTASRRFLQTLLRGVGYARYEIPWERMDLSDPERPRVNCVGAGSSPKA